MIPSFRKTHLERLVDREREAEISNEDEEVDPQASLSFLDRVASEWYQYERTTPLMHTLFTPDCFWELTRNDAPELREFGFIFLRLAIADEIDDRLIPLLDHLFRIRFQDGSMAARILLLKLFLKGLETSDEDQREAMLSTGLQSSVSWYAQEYFTTLDLEEFAQPLRFISETFKHENQEDQVDPDQCLPLTSAQQ